VTESPLADQVGARLAGGAVVDEMMEVRHHLHQHPELSNAEFETTAFIKDRLGDLGLIDRRAPIPTGAVFELHGAKPGPLVVLRADIDALPVHEEVASTFPSLVDGQMHACGHDVHTAALLGVARVLAERQEDLAGRYVFLFQPAEEKLCGARAMVEAGVLDGLEGAHLVGCHVTSLLPVGMVGVRAGIAMAEAREVRIELHGPGGHGAVPTGGGDVIGAIGELIAKLTGIVEGLEYEGTNCICSLGQIEAGSAINVTPDHAVLGGTLRTFTDSQRQEALLRFAARVEEVADGRGVSIELTYPESAPAVVNDPAVTATVEEAARCVLDAKDVLRLPPTAPSDDVSEFLNRIPGCYFFVGGGGSELAPRMHHSPTFFVEDGALAVAASILARSALALGAAGPS
jgi:amidohydrolase